MGRSLTIRGQSRREQLAMSRVKTISDNEFWRLAAERMVPRTPFHCNRGPSEPMQRKATALPAGSQPAQDDSSWPQVSAVWFFTLDNRRAESLCYEARSPCGSELADPGVVSQAYCESVKRREMEK